MWKILWRALILFAGLTILTGILYPLAVTGIAQLFFPGQANGSIARQNGKVIGSVLIGQEFQGPGYFHGRPSASQYDALASGGSNMAQTNKKLSQAVASRKARIQQENRLPSGQPVPGDLVTSSASGLDPHITPDGAMLQVHRVAAARGLRDEVLRQLVNKYTERPFLGMFGMPRVNVLKLNMALDSLKGGG